MASINILQVLLVKWLSCLSNSQDFPTLTLSQRYMSIRFDAQFNYHTRYMSRTFDGVLFNVKLAKSA
jgi:hypothetical protein